MAAAVIEPSLVPHDVGVDEINVTANVDAEQSTGPGSSPLEQFIKINNDIEMITMKAVRFLICIYCG